MRVEDMPQVPAQEPPTGSEATVQAGVGGETACREGRTLNHDLENGSRENEGRC